MVLNESLQNDSENDSDILFDDEIDDEYNDETYEVTSAELREAVREENEDFQSSNRPQTSKVFSI